MGSGKGEDIGRGRIQDLRWVRIPGMGEGS